MKQSTKGLGGNKREKEEERAGAPQLANEQGNEHLATPRRKGLAVS